ncbi:MAG: 3-phytase [Pseudomonas citronellolis]|nr:MAG: 3-phytase [Pseudomonas citronellolis]
MPHHRRTHLPRLLGALALAIQAVSAGAADLAPWPAQGPAPRSEASAWLPAGPAWNGADRAVASKRLGLQLLDAQGHVRGELAGRLEGLDVRALSAEDALLASFDREHQQPLLLSLHADGRWGTSLHLPAPDFAVNGQCLYRDDASNLYLFLVGENGQGEQWLVGHGASLASAASKVRRLALPPSAEECRVDDRDGTLYVDESGIGLWAYDAHPESDGSRLPVDLAQPHGQLVSSPSGLAVVPGTVFLLDAKARQLQGYQRHGDTWQRLAASALNGPAKPEGLSLRAAAQGLDLLLQDNRDGRYYQARLPSPPTAPAAATVIPSVMPSVQTQSVDRHGDAADDPAIWVNPRDPQRSRVLGTNKQEGLVVFDLDGKQVQSLPAGLVNNVDVRNGFDFGGQRIDLAVASNRSDNSLTVFGIDPANGTVSEIGRVPTPLTEVYGICLYSPRAGDIQAIVNDKDGRFLQYRLSAPGKQVKGELLRQFKVGSQPEGCVADDARQRLFIGEEDVAVWTLSANPAQPADLKQVLAVGEQLHADVEGLALYHGDKASYLLVSSQGNDSYLVLDAVAPYRLRGAFRIGLNAAAGIDGSAETDGIEVTSANLGGAFRQGLFVAQDGRKRLPEGTQNFKYVSWAEIARTLNLD